MEFYEIISNFFPLLQDCRFDHLKFSKSSKYKQLINLLSSEVIPYQELLSTRFLIVIHKNT